MDALRSSNNRRYQNEHGTLLLIGGDKNKKKREGGHCERGRKGRVKKKTRGNKLMKIEVEGQI